MPSSDPGLLLLHALPLDGRMWAGQCDLVPERTYAPNLYEFGDSVTAWAEGCLDRFPAERLVVVGCSVGGSCALEILNRAPERVAALVLIGTKAHHDPEPAFLAAAVRLIETEGVEAGWRRYWEPLFDFPGHDAARELCEKIALEQSPEHLIKGLRAFHGRASLEHVVAESHCPVHIVTGGLDSYPGLAYARDLTGMTSNAQMHVVDGSGHYVPAVKPDEITAIVSKVMRTV